MPEKQFTWNLSRSYGTCERGSTGKRKSSKESIFAAKHAEVLRPIYKSYQAMMFATHGHNFQWDAVKRKGCVQMLIDAARQCHPSETYTRFKKAVVAELVGKDGAPRYWPLRMMFG